MYDYRRRACLRTRLQRSNAHARVGGRPFVKPFRGNRRRASRFRANSWFAYRVCELSYIFILYALTICTANRRLDCRVTRAAENIDPRTRKRSSARARVELHSMRARDESNARVAR